MLVAVTATLLAGCIQGGAGRGFRASGPPRPLPSERLAPVDGDAFESMLVGLRGRPVVVNLWASWCGPCRVEAPLLQRASERYRGRVVFLGVDSRDDRAAGLRFIRRYGIRYANVFDGSGEIRQRLTLRGFPTTYIFGRDGTLLSSVVGGISEQALAARLSDALRR